nr:chemotaxis protein CheA [Vampirovibrio sp.]
MTSINDDSILQEFIAEGKEHLSAIEPDLLELENNGAKTDSEVINRIFRAIHSIKGAAGFFGLDALKELSHVMESVLMQVRDGKLTPSSEMMDPLLLGVDRLNEMFADVHESSNVAYEDIASKLEAILNGGEAPPSGETVAITQAGSANDADIQTAINLFQADKDRLSEARRNGQHLYSLEVHLDEDIKNKEKTPLSFVDNLGSMGTILDSVFNLDAIPDLAGCLNTGISFLFLYASVLDKDLLAGGADIPESQVSIVPYEQVLPDGNSTAEKPAETQTANTTESPTAETNEPAEKEAQKTPAKRQASAESTETIRVKVEVLNKLMNMAGEMVLIRNQLIRMLQQTASDHDGMHSILQNLDLTTTNLQEHIMQTRMQPIGSIFGKFPRVVRDMCKILGKEIQLDVIGDDVELDKSLLESLSDPLTHAIRNCCDHGLEMPDDREQAGKPRAGTITLHASHEGGQIKISITDDGKGINHHKIAEKAVERGVITEANLSKMSPKEIVNLVFLPGFSMAKEVSDISGRGVGMDVVRTNIEKLGGSVNIETELGTGTSVTMRLPLTLAIIPSLVVGTEGFRFALPQVNLVELIRIQADEIAKRVETVGGASVLRLRGKLLPLVRLADVLDVKRKFTHPEDETIYMDRRKNIADRRKHKADDLIGLDLPEEQQENVNPDTLQRLMDSNGMEDEAARFPQRSDEPRRKNPESDYYVVVVQVGFNQYGMIVDQVNDMEEIVVKP